MPLLSSLSVCVADFAIPFLCLQFVPHFCFSSVDCHQHSPSLKLIFILMKILCYDFMFSFPQVFLLAHCKDNGLYLRTLATGTELHALKGHKSKVNKRSENNMKFEPNCLTSTVFIVANEMCV